MVELSGQPEAGSLATYDESANGTPVLCSVARIRSTVATGDCCLSTAQAPATCGAAIDVPAIITYSLVTALLTPSVEDSIR